MDDRRMTSDGTYVYVLNGNGIKKVTIATGASATLAPTYKFNCIVYGNSTLYAADNAAIYNVDEGTGAATKILNYDAVQDLEVKDADEIIALTGNVLYTLNASTGAITDTLGRDFN